LPRSFRFDISSSSVRGSRLIPAQSLTGRNAFLSVGVAAVEPRVVLVEVPSERDDLDVHRYHNDLVSASLRGGEGSSGPSQNMLR
jgi:hypothetical protein